MTSTPNVLLIFVDNQPASMMGCSGNTEIFTPNLDSLAEQGTRFSQAFCPNAMCSPCRASVLTGLTPSQHGIHTWIDDDKIDEWPQHWNAIAEFDSLPKRLSLSGYNTALIGKYHLGRADHPQNSFDEWVTMQTGHVLSFYDNKMIADGNQFIYSGHSVDFFTQRAVEYIERRCKKPEQPFFMFLTYPAPYGHWPSIQGEPNNKFSATYQKTPFNSVPREAISKELLDWMTIRHEKMPADDAQFYNDLARLPNDLPTLRNYYSQMSLVDQGVGRVLDALERSNLSDETLIIYTSDHGMSLGQHGFWGHGEDTWPSNTHREANHIPLIVKAPDSGRKRSVVDSLVGTTDIYATILDYTVGQMPTAEQSPARSLRNLIESETADWDDVVFMEQEETRSIRTREWLLMKRFGPTSYGFRNELYDLVADPDERNNLADDPDYDSTLTALAKKIDAYFAQYSNEKWDLWNGGTVKSNSTRPFLWQEVWGDSWKPGY